MSCLQNRKFTFTWQIMNFSMCPQKYRESITSPVFVVGMFGSSEWELVFFPKGRTKENYLRTNLVCRSVGNNIHGVSVGCSLTIFAEDLKKRITFEKKSRVFQNDESWNCALSQIDEIFGDKKTYLPNDTLTVVCSICRSEDSNGEEDFSSDEDDGSSGDEDGTSGHIDHQVVALALDGEAHNSGECEECSMVTRIGVQRKNASWAIKSFSSIRLNEKLVTHVPSALKDVPSFIITLCKPAADHSAEIEIQTMDKLSSKRVLVKCKVMVMQTPEGVEYFAEDEHLFDPDANSVWKFPSFINLDKLQEDKYFNATSDVLHLRFEFSFSLFGDLHHFETVSFRQCGVFASFSEPMEEFRRLYEDGDLSDVTLRAGDRDFKVHRNILKARSPVFGAMFERDMKEKESGVANITNIDPDTLDKMLAFMYSNALDDLQSEDAIKLYSAADQYQVLSLKFRCTWILASLISSSNVCEVLVLANQHSDYYLRDWAESFIRANAMEVFKSQEWESLMKNYTTVSANVMFKMLTL